MECKLDSITIHYEVRGSGIPILMLHGYSCDHQLMMGCMEPLFEERLGWQRIYIDLPGMGLTKGEDWINSTDDMLSVVEQFVDAELPGQRFVLAGASYGGYLARGLLSKRFEQIDGMLLICPVVRKEKRKLPMFTVLERDEVFLKKLQPKQVEEFTAMHVVQDRYNWERFEAEILSGVQSADYSFLERIRQQYDFTFKPEPFPRPYEKPVLILTGRQDHVVGYHNQWEIVEHYPRASFALLDRAGHNLQIEQSQLFNALVNEWLDQVEKNAIS
ncbi:alpha/beta fold hydrolase [Shimazuella kribbensis]|uniref:alpha/beta fold hydrolase n=1 Tax=Shimazuella kribbensis TaxID=139808 RepID=UPI0004030521|nr:alpha/beta hydrolase [Shimazuella kribbensis]